MNSLIKSATIIDKKSDFHNSKVDILIENNIITNIGKNLKNPKNYKEISFNNLHVSKGWFDYSVCFGEPGYEERETILNGITVAAKSGFTSVGLQPNTCPIIEKNTEIEYINSIPNFGKNYNPNLFDKVDRGDVVSRFLAQFFAIFSPLGGEGGLFIIVGKKSDSINNL